MTIHTFGDSHCNLPWDKLSYISRHHLGPKLCYSFGRDGLDISRNYGVVNGDTVIFCLGEIDCRCHVHKYITTENTYKNVIDSIVDKYFIRIKESVSCFSHLKTAVFNVVPPIQKHTIVEHPTYPHMGSDEERKAYVLYFNEKIKEKCIEYNFTFFNVYDKYIDENGFLIKSLSDGITHINDPVYVNEFIQKYL